MVERVVVARVTGRRVVTSYLRQPLTMQGEECKAVASGTLKPNFWVGQQGSNLQPRSHVRRGSGLTVNGESVHGASEAKPAPTANELWLQAHQQWSREVAADIARTRAELPAPWTLEQRICAVLIPLILLVGVVLLFATA